MISVSDVEENQLFSPAGFCSVSVISAITNGQKQNFYLLSLPVSIVNKNLHL